MKGNAVILARALADDNIHSVRTNSVTPVFIFSAVVVASLPFVECFVGCNSLY